jgi:hypothetical protein
LKRNKKSSKNNNIYQYSSECLSPSPSPTTSPSSKIATYTNDEVPTLSFIAKSTTSNNASDNLNSLLLGKYLKGDEESFSKQHNQTVNETSTKGKVKKMQSNTLQNTIGVIDSLSNSANNLITALHKTPKLNHLENLKEYARMKQKKFILSRLIYFKSNKILR